MNTSTLRSKLTPPEWLSVLLFLIVTSSFTGLAYFTRTPELPTDLAEPIYITSREISIHLSGAVVNPGIVMVSKGTTLKELFDKVEFQPEADISKLKLNKVLRKGQKIKIPIKKKTRNQKVKQTCFQQGFEDQAIEQNVNQ